MIKTYMKLVNDCSHDIQNLGLSCIGNVSVVVDQNSLKQRRDHISVHHVRIVGLLHVGIDQLKDLLLDGAKPTNFGGLGGDRS